MDESNLDNVNQNDEATRDSSNLLSDVIEVITTDPDFSESSNTQQSNTMFNGGGEISQQQQQPALQQQSATQQPRRQPYVRIIEQPASKALRFRYECEGRSAGSIPGASSTPENKTFPTIQIVGHQSRAVVVVSCVTKDAPYRPHPHNLVGREGCKRGVCTLEIPTDTMTVHFSNLGIQCVKKKDIEHALRVREEIRVDPFRTGFGHRNQPTSIDLNAVRLCFQVFLEGNTPGKFSVPLPAVVSEPIYDKKAMSDLSIIKLSDCVSYVDGGRKDIILLCEKVAKEDIQIRFYEEKGDWEAFADFQPSQVHKQHAIWFRTPRYKTLEVTEPVKVFIQLRRPSDGATSEPLPFELLPLDSGRPPYWSFRRNFAKKANYNLFNSILANDAKLVAKRQLGKLIEDNEQEQAVESPAATASVEIQPQTVAASDEADLNTTWSEAMETNNNDIKSQEMDYADVVKLNKDDNILLSNNNNNKTEEKSFNELINQVAELDEIYSDTQARLQRDLKELDRPLQDVPFNESFDDAKTYSSLQLAFKNPIEIDLKATNDVVVVSPVAPVINMPLNNKRENEIEKLPPLPPKRTKKIETYIGGSMTSIQLTETPSENKLNRSNSTRNAPVRSQSFNLQRPKSQAELIPPGKRLPPTPNFSTLPNPKKKGFFSRLFNRKSKTPGTSRETSVTPSAKSNLFSSTKSLQADSNLGKSSGNISTHSANSIRIPLKDSPPSSNLNLAIPDSSALFPLVNKNPLNLTNDDFDMNLDLTEAEHYALYTAMAPHATQSEFDEMSCYYAPVEGEPGILKRKRQKIDDPSLILKHLQDADSKNRFSMNMMDKIKSEPRDSTPSPYGSLHPYGGISPGYVPNLSPQSYIGQGPTPSPPDYQYNIPTNNPNIPEGSPQPPLWNSPSSSTGMPVATLQNPVWNITSAMANPVPQSENLLFDLDNRVNINSDELDATLKTMGVDPTPLPEIENLSFSDVPPNQDQNMTDSLTRLANNTLDSICQLNNMYPPQ